MVRIRLRRVGARNQPSYRIVAADKRHPRDGRFLEILGHYNPRTEPATIQVNEERLYFWLQSGAQASGSVEKILKTAGAWERWERFKGGEAIEGLLAEAEAAFEAVDPRTRREDLERRKPSKKSAARAEAAAEAEAEPEPAAEAPEAEEDAPAEAEVEEAEAPAEVEEEPAAEEVAESSEEEAPESEAEPPESEEDEAEG